MTLTFLFWKRCDPKMWIHGTLKQGDPWTLTLICFNVPSKVLLQIQYISLQQLQKYNFSLLLLYFFFLHVQMHLKEILVFQFSMPYTKSHFFRGFWKKKKDSFKVVGIYGHWSHLGQWTEPVKQTIGWFGWNGSLGYRENVFLKIWNLDKGNDGKWLTVTDSQ